jgi:hypothetical protein
MRKNLAPLGIQSPDRPACSSPSTHDTCIQSIIPIRSTVQDLPLPLLSAAVNKETSSALFWGITQRRKVIPFRRFGTTYRSHIQGSRNLHLSVPYSRVKKSTPIGPIFKGQELCTYRSHLQGSTNLHLSVPHSRVKKSTPIGPILKGQEICTYRYGITSPRCVISHVISHLHRGGSLKRKKTSVMGQE